MAADHFIQCRVNAETKARLRAAAQREQLTQSAFLKRLLALTVNATTVDSSRPTPAAARFTSRRLSVRVHPEDALLLQARADARGIPPATYASAALRAHLHGTAPLPKAELEILRRTVADLGTLSRHIRTIALATSAGASAAAVASRADCMAMLKVCQALRDHVHDLIAANLRSWTGGHAK